MSKTENELKEVKCIIRGLLTSSTVATTIRHLESDYRSEVGSDIPFQKFGYPSTEAFLRSITDTVCLKEPRHGCPSSMIIVQLVQSKKSDHVEKFVVQQKKPSSGMRGMKRASAVSSHLFEKRTSSSMYSTPNGLAPSFVPMALRVSLKRVCQRYSQDGLLLSSLGDELSNDLYMAGWLQDGKSGWLSTFGFRNMDDVIDAFIENGLIKIIIKNGMKWIAPNVEKAFLAVEKHILDAGQEDDVDDVDDVLVLDEDATDAAALVSDKMKLNFRAIMRKYPKGLWCSSLPQSYKELTGYNLDVKELGFVSVIQMAINLKDVFLCYRPDKNSDWLLFDSESNSVWDSPSAPVAKETKRASLPLHIIHNVETLLQEHSRGIVKHKFLSAYKERFNEELPMADYGFENMMSLLAHLASRNVIHLKFCDNVPMICSPFSNREENSFKELRQENDFINVLYPRGVMLPHDHIPAQAIPEGLSSGCSIDILITEVTSPSLFWFQLWGADIQAEFNTMMDDLQDFYNPGGPADHKMPDATIQIGQLCAARFPPDPKECGEWHRAQITSLPSLTEVEVHYIDYGSKCKVLRSEIRFLDVKYGKLPVQAYKASLVNVRPIGYGLWLEQRASASSEDFIERKPLWSAAASNAFLKMVQNHPLVGVVGSLYQDMVSFALTDTSGDDDRHINDLLVYTNMAEFGEIAEEDDLLFRESIRPSNSQATYELGEKSLHKVEDKCISPGLRPPSVERTVAPDINEHTHFQFDGKFPAGAKMESSGEKNRFGSELSETQLLCAAELPNTNIISPVSVKHSVEKGRFGPGIDEIHLGSAAGLAESTATSSLPKQCLLQEKVQTLQQEEVPGYEAKKGDGMNYVENKIMKEAQIQLELEKYKFYQQQLQYQQFQTQLLLLASQNPLMVGLPTVPNPLLGHQVIPPPPGLSHLNPLMNAQAGFSNLISRALMNTNPLAGLPTSFLPGTIPPSGNFPVGSFGNPQFPCITPLGGTHFMDSGDSPSGSTPSHPPGVGCNVAGPDSPKNTWPSSPLLPVPASYQPNLSDKLSNQLAPEEKMSLHVSEKSSDVVINDLNVGNSGISESVPNFSSAEKNVVLNSKLNPSSVLLDNGLDNADGKSFVKNKIFSERKSQTFENLHTSLEACSISGDSDSSSVDELKKRNDSQDKSESRDEEKWKVNFEVSDEDDKQAILKGTVNGKPVHVIKNGYFYYVLTEEILGLFYDNLPVHVAMKIANLKPKGKKINHIVINARKNKELCEKIRRLGQDEMCGSDIHLTSVESLFYLCSSLEIAN